MDSQLRINLDSVKLSFVRLTRFVARLMARPRVTLLISNTLSMVSSNVNRPSRL